MSLYSVYEVNVDGAAKVGAFGDPKAAIAFAESHARRLAASPWAVSVVVLGFDREWARFAVKDDPARRAADQCQIDDYYGPEGE